MTKNNELKTYIVTTNTSLTAVTLARTEEEALLKARVYFCTEQGADILEGLLMSAREFDNEFEVIGNY